MAWWREARFGMFVHWGLYAETGGSWKGQPENKSGKNGRASSEWIMNRNRIPVADYKKLAANFDPTKFNADQWVAMAKASGVKYIVITAKHHDGFAMFDSPTNKFNIVDATSFKRDPLMELAIACHKQGIKLGFYYSQVQDWTAPGGQASGGHWDSAQNGSFADYIHTKVIPQLTELLNNYQAEGAPVEIWFDTPLGQMTPQLASEIVAVLNKHPNVIWNNRLGGGYEGDFLTPERRIPSHGYPGKDWETCMSITSDTWGYRAHDTNFIPEAILLKNLIDIVSKGGNYLLNVGPDATGVIPQPEQDRLLAMGKWLKMNGNAIYGAGPAPFKDDHGSYSATQKETDGKPLWQPVWDWRATAKPGRIFISVFQYPKTPLVLPPIKERVRKAYMMADPRHRALPLSQSAGGINVTLPSTAPDPVASVLVLETRDAM